MNQAIRQFVFSFHLIRNKRLGEFYNFNITGLIVSNGFVFRVPLDFVHKAKKARRAIARVVFNPLTPMLAVTGRAEP